MIDFSISLILPFGPILLPVVVRDPSYCFYAFYARAKFIIGAILHRTMMRIIWRELSILRLSHHTPESCFWYTQGISEKGLTDSHRPDTEVRGPSITTRCIPNIRPQLLLSSRLSFKGFIIINIP